MAPLHVIETLTTDIEAGDSGSTERRFAEHGAPAPRIVWRPQQDDLPHAPLKFLLAYWTEKRGNAEMPLAGAIDPIEMKPALGFIMLLDVIDGGADFRYRVYGTAIVERTGMDWTGKSVSDLAARYYTGLFYAAVYRAALRRREPVATVSSSPRHVAATEGSRLVLPLRDSSGAIIRFLVGNVPGSWRPPQ